jgi:hypothetical protein
VAAGARIGLGWMDGSARNGNPGDVLDVMEKHFGGDTKDGPRTGWHGASLSFDHGRASVFWEGRGNAKETTRVEVTQGGCDGLGFDGSIALARDLVAVGWKSRARMDVYLDDYDGRISPAKARAAVRAGQVVTHARAAKEGACPGKFIDNDYDVTTSYYLGQPSSDRQLRIYDKRGPTRVELQARRAAAVAVLDSLLGAEDPGRAVLGNLVSFADFRESRGRTGLGHRRAARLGWWGDLVGEAAKVEGVPAAPDRSLAERAEWFDRSLGATLAELERDMGPEWVEAVLRKGHQKLRARKLRMVG